MDSIYDRNCRQTIRVTMERCKNAPKIIRMTTSVRKRIQLL